ncbi:MAG: DUF58 domain-containing protein [Armatimonadota bacterium]|nr:DUF58 domain-containing protein [Armatimonadota bacterium]
MTTTFMPPILDTSALRLLEGQSLAPRRMLASRLRGERLSRQKGVSIEFADYRDYADGDDLRHLDWTILARLDRPTIRTYQDEAELSVYLALDTSASMDFGEPSKFAHAQRLAAALGFVGLIGHDSVLPLTVGGREPRPGRAQRGRGSLRTLTDWLSAQRPDGTRGLSASLSRLSSLRPGLFLLFTDGLEPDFGNALRAVTARGHELMLVQILSDIELDPDLEGDLRLLDAETGEAVEVTAHAQTLREYKANLDAHCQRLEEAVLRLGGRFYQSRANQPLSEFVSGLRRLGLVT